MTEGTALEELVDTYAEQHLESGMPYQEIRNLLSSQHLLAPSDVNAAMSMVDDVVIQITAAREARKNWGSVYRAFLFSNLITFSLAGYMIYNYLQGYPPVTATHGHDLVLIIPSGGSLWGMVHARRKMARYARGEQRSLSFGTSRWNTLKSPRP